VQIEKPQRPSAKAINRLDALLAPVFHFLSSLKLAVVVLLSLAGSLAVGTILESLYDTPTAQYYVYRSLWFHGVLALLGVNIFCSAMSRFPWKARHTPFLVAHIGILMMLFGSWVTEQYGLDGHMRITEGETSSLVEYDQNNLLIIDQNEVHSIPIQWIPSDVKFKPFTAASRGFNYELKVDNFLSHADSQFSFVPPESASAANGPKKSALKMRIKGGPMGISQEFWLWQGDPNWAYLEMGPARFAILDKGGAEPALVAGRPLLVIFREESGIHYKAYSSEGKLKEGKLKFSEIKDYGLDPGWKNVKIDFEQWLPQAVPFTDYVPSRMEYGAGAPPPAIHVVAGNGGKGAEIWLGLGDRVGLQIPQGNSVKEIEVAFFPRRAVLPFSVKLERFTVERYSGTNDPAAYSSKVSVSGGGGTEGPREDLADQTIQMNEPLHFKGITLYQASYEDAQPRPVTSIFSVNRDPGRIWKYLGSILIVGGAILLFGMRYRKAKTTKNAVSTSAASGKKTGKSVSEATG
jgi:hypothetical protein